MTERQLRQFVAFIEAYEHGKQGFAGLEGSAHSEGEAEGLHGSDDGPQSASEPVRRSRRPGARCLDRGLVRGVGVGIPVTGATRRITF